MTGVQTCALPISNYNALGGAFHQFDPVAFDYVNLPAWLIFDEEFRRRYPVGGLPPTNLRVMGNVCPMTAEYAQR